MALPLKEYVQQVLLERDRAGRMHNAVHKAWRETNLEYPQRGRWLRKATFRGLLWEAAVGELDKLSHDDDQFRPIFHKDTASFIVEDSVLFRFKHADTTLSTSNYQTAEAAAFDDHEVDLWGFKGIQRVELCYVLDEFETELAWVGVSARLKGRFLWKLELNAEGIAPVEQIELLETEADVARLAQLKQAGHDRENKKDQG